MGCCSSQCALCAHHIVLCPPNLKPRTPVRLYVSYRIIKWTLEHSTGGKTELQSLLESCTSELMKVARYKSDQRYLRLWIQYVRAGSC